MNKNNVYPIIAWWRVLTSIIRKILFSFTERIFALIPCAKDSLSLSYEFFKVLLNVNRSFQQNIHQTISKSLPPLGVRLWEDISHDWTREVKFAMQFVFSFLWGWVYFLVIYVLKEQFVFFKYTFGELLKFNSIKTYLL